MALIFLIILAIPSFLIAHFLGSKRQIGFGMSFILNLLLSPFIGFIIVMTSRKFYDENPDPSKIKVVLGWILIIFFLNMTLGGLIIIFSGNVIPMAYNTTSMSIGFMILGYYLIQIGKGKNLNSDKISEYKNLE